MTSQTFGEKSYFSCQKSCGFSGLHPLECKLVAGNGTHGTVQMTIKPFSIFSNPNSGFFRLLSMRNTLSKKWKTINLEQQKWNKFHGSLVQILSQTNIGNTRWTIKIAIVSNGKDEFKFQLTGIIAQHVN